MQFIVFDSIKSFIKIRPKFCEFFLKIYAVIGACVQSEIDPTFHSDIYKTKNIICLHSKINKCWMNALFSATIFFFAGDQPHWKRHSHSREMTAPILHVDIVSHTCFKPFKLLGKKRFIRTNGPFKNETMCTFPHFQRLPV